MNEPKIIVTFVGADANKTRHAVEVLLKDGDTVVVNANTVGLPPGNYRIELPPGRLRAGVAIA